MRARYLDEWPPDRGASLEVSLLQVPDFSPGSHFPVSLEGGEGQMSSQHVNCRLTGESVTMHCKHGLVTSAQHRLYL